MNFEEIKQALKNDDYIKRNAFYLLKNITNFYNDDILDKRKSQELILCALEKRPPLYKHLSC